MRQKIGSLKKVPLDGAKLSLISKRTAKNNKKVRNSNLPASIPKDRTHFEKFGISSKLYAGPIKLLSLVQLDIDVAAAETMLKYLDLIKKKK